MDCTRVPPVDETITGHGTPLHAIYELWLQRRLDDAGRNCVLHPGSASLLSQIASQSFCFS